MTYLERLTRYAAFLTERFGFVPALWVIVHPDDLPEVDTPAVHALGFKSFHGDPKSPRGQLTIQEMMMEAPT